MDTLFIELADLELQLKKAVTEEERDWIAKKIDDLEYEIDEMNYSESKGNRVSKFRGIQDY